MTSGDPMAGDRVTADDTVSGYRSHAHAYAQSGNTEKAVTGCHLSPAQPEGAVTGSGPAGIAAADRWGPFADGLDTAERVARLRSMRAIVHLTTGPRGDALARELRLAERDPARLPAAVAALDALAALDRRHVLASFARLLRTD